MMERRRWEGEEREEDGRQPTHRRLSHCKFGAFEVPVTKGPGDGETACYTQQRLL